jgi:hypothetical protein
VATIALADSINPSTLIPAMWLASGPSRRRLGSYTLGVFAVYSWIMSARGRLRYVTQLVLSAVAAAAGTALLTIGLVGLLEV